MARLDAAHPASPVQAQHSATTRVTHWLSRSLTKIVEWQERAEQRVHLAGMDERMRKDIGISYADAVREADKPFWRV
ncbi:MAG: DUF1127 domain-containing protein [Alphaproteobacteria bacterium]